MDERDDTLLQEFNNRFIAGQQAVLYDAPEALYRQQGEAAMQAAPQAVARLDTLKKGLVEQAPPALRAALDSMLDGHFRSNADEIGRHVTQQTQAWQRAVAQERIDLATRQALLEDHDPVKVGLFAEVAGGAAREIALLSGLSPDSGGAVSGATAMRSTIHRRAIEHALGRGDGATAFRLHDAAQPHLVAGDAYVVQRQIETARQAEAARVWLAANPLPAAHPDALADTGVADVSDRLAAIATWQAEMTARNGADFAHDPPLHATVQLGIDVAAGKAARAMKQADAKLVGGVTNWLTTPAADGEPRTDRPPPMLWNQLNPERRQAVDAALARNARGGDHERLALPPPAQSATLDGSALPVVFDMAQQPSTDTGSGSIEMAADNRRQNKMVRDIQVQLGLSAAQREQLHRAISGQGLSYQEILLQAKDMFGK